MTAYIVAFHPGFYGRKTRKKAFNKCIEALKSVAETMNTLGIKNVKIGPETMGKRSQFGSLDEVLGICEEVEQTQPVIDWAHLHARNLGRFNVVDDFRKVVEEIEGRLGAEALKGLHCHFAKVEFTDKGERRHCILAEARYGPDFEMFAKIIAEFKLKPVVISESPLLDLDAMKMRDTLRKELS